jgi:hypothetical protein
MIADHGRLDLLYRTSKKAFTLTAYKAVLKLFIINPFSLCINFIHLNFATLLYYGSYYTGRIL